MAESVASLALSRASNCRSVVIITAAVPCSPFSIPQGEVRIQNIAFDAITAPFLMREAPDCILAPLVIGPFDILDIAERLVAFGYTGLLLATSPPLPNPNLIRAEMRSIFPSIRFDLLEVQPVP